MLELPDDSTRPVLSALSQAYAEKMSALAATAAEAQSFVVKPGPKTHETEVMNIVTRMILLASDAEELLRWIYPPKVMSMEDATNRAEAFRSLGDAWVQTMRAGLQKLTVGKPARIRQAHIAAFEFMLLSKGNSIGRAASKFCPCGKCHDAKCTERFKTGVRTLKKILCKYAPGLVYRYDVLHPNRNHS